MVLFMETANNLTAVVLAAGKGTRMHSDKPKVLQTILGEPMLGHVLDALREALQALGRAMACGQAVTIIGHQAEQVQALFPKERFVVQSEQLGTGHALACAWPEILNDKADWCLVVNGDTPLLEAAAVAGFCQAMREEQVDVGFLTMQMADPLSYGRVIRDSHGQVLGIVEAKDYDPAKHGRPSGEPGSEPSSEVNAGVYLLRVESAGPLLSLLTTDNSQGEYYLTELIGLALQHGLQVRAMCLAAQSAAAFLGVNSPAELAAAEEELRRRLVAAWLHQGVIIHFPETVRIGPAARLEPGAELCGPCELYGRTFVGSGAMLESHVWIKDSQIGPGSVIRSFSHLEGASLGQGCVVGPFARLRPESVLENRARVGNFVEIKKARLGTRAKANHLSYIGDAEVGPGANIGAGTITCNYDGQSKHQTVIGANAFIGSNTALVAPVRVGDNALIGAGSVITRDVPADTLALARGQQQCFPKTK
jgi:bifunctional UDP-N-acetylglucosamine pyrophosphorylase/glucosamine-1-phosphate N-acetyltransferase